MIMRSKVLRFMRGIYIDQEFFVFKLDNVLTLLAEELSSLFDVWVLPALLDDPQPPLFSGDDDFEPSGGNDCLFAAAWRVGDTPLEAHIDQKLITGSVPLGGWEVDDGNETGGNGALASSWDNVVPLWVNINVGPKSSPSKKDVSIWALVTVELGDAWDDSSSLSL